MLLGSCRRVIQARSKKTAIGCCARLVTRLGSHPWSQYLLSMRDCSTQHLTMSRFLRYSLPFLLQFTRGHQQCLARNECAAVRRSVSVRLSLQDPANPWSRSRVMSW